MTNPTFPLGRLQTLRKLVLIGVSIAVLAAFAFTRSSHPPAIQALIEWTGVGLIVVCILGRAWCALYIGGRKLKQLVTAGPYSLCRNPLYVFSFIGAAGALAQSGSLVIAAVGTAICWLIFRAVVSTEEPLLLRLYGEAYEGYLARTPRFAPDFRLWRDLETVEVMPKKLLQTVLDGFAFLLIVPIAAVIDYLQVTGGLPVLVSLP